MRRFLGRFAQGELRLTRIEAFSDGVFAIVVTLLVLEIKVPALRDHGSVIPSTLQVPEAQTSHVALTVLLLWCDTLTLSAREIASE